VELTGTFSRGATIVDWNRQTGQPDNCDLLMAYDQAFRGARGVRSVGGLIVLAWTAWMGAYNAALDHQPIYGVSP
jgi:hypothetical protein